MTSRWPQRTLNEAGVRLFDCEHKTPPDRGEGYPYVAIPQIQAGRLILNGVRRISAADFEGWTRRVRPQADDVVVVRRCNSGETAFVPPGLEFALGQNLVILRADPHRLHPPFLRWLLSGAEWWERIREYINVGAVFDSLRCADIPQFRMTIPPLNQQRAIARILGALDDKIELNRRTNETLEAMARAIFQSWFVDFEPVRAKMEGRQPEGMDAETAKLFPSALAGELPAGWRHEPISSSGDLFDGPHATPPTTDAGPVFLGIRNFRPTNLDLTDVRHIAEVDFAQWTRRVEPRDGDIVFTYEATLGFFALIPPGLRCCLGRRTALFRAREAASRWFTFHWFTAEPFQAHLLKHRQPGSTVDRIWLTDFPTYPLLDVPEPLRRRFTDLAAPLWRNIQASQAQMLSVATLREALLPKLLSGDLRVPEAERAVSAAL